MSKKKSDFELEEYIDDDYYNEQNFYSSSNRKIEKVSKEEDDYNNFFKVDKEEYDDDYDSYDDYGEVDEAYTYDSSSGLYKFLSIFLMVFKWIGIVIAVILIAYFITQGNIKSLFLYIIGLVIAFFFGYFFMYILNLFTEG